MESNPVTTTDHEPLPDLTTQVQYLKGVGPRRAELLNRMDIRTATDLLFCFPRSYQDWSERVLLAELVEGQAASVCGVVEKIDLRPTGRGRSRLTVVVLPIAHIVSPTTINGLKLPSRLK